MSAGNALLRAIHAQLSADTLLKGMIGPAGLIDRLMPRTVLPCVVTGELESRDYSTASEKGEEHLLTLEVWCDAGGRKKAQDIASRIMVLLDDAALVLDDGAVLVSLFYRSMRSRRETKAQQFVTEIRFRAVTE
ncbi:DUF3168 domain-containing protein [Agrobacterium larrymoorei]|uniref:DUF3168 domain-containing protein n=1 Tax=Agrobacterium larrymoorei TaxID=160699 RepID=A0A4D7DRN1_9HYPH|nr:DUF3168 domain-containing protein [Agrobacterium larrymoorei]QCI98337.1 DUF3168 domain-containing protein [Agrobacterium larrymoorei]QYA06209.1 DUF3168 domain-containing protein [Agrobacterium larrymoorei]